MALMDFLRPQWKRSDPEIRAAALRALQDDRQDVFLSVALEDPDPALRQQSAKRVNTENALQQLLAKSTDTGVQELARKALNKALGEKAKTSISADAATVQGWLKSLEGESKILEDLARNSVAVEVRRQAAAALTHASAILAVAMNEENPDIALTALNRLTREAHLQSVAKSARSKEARAAAKEKLKAADTAKKPDENSVQRAKLQVLVTAVEKADQGSAAPPVNFDWEATRDQVEEADHAWRDLTDSGRRAEAETASRFAAHVSAFRSRYAQRAAAATERLAREGQARQREEAAQRQQEINRELRRQREEEEAERRRVEAETQAALQAQALRDAEAWQRNLAEAETHIAEVENLSEAADLVAAEKRFRMLHARCKNLLSNPPDARAEELVTRYRRAADKFREVIDWHRWSNHRRKQDICDQLEALLPLEDRKAMVARFKEFLAEWKTIGPVPWENTEALWDRYHTICDALYEKCREYFAELDVERESNSKAKEEICARLETLLAEPEFDWRETTEAFREAQSLWKSLGAVPREKNEALWARFRAVCQDFYGRKDQHQSENLKRKLALVESVEALRDSQDWKATAAKIKEAQEKWKSIGPVPKENAEALWQKFHGLCEAFFQARRAYFEKLDQDRPANQEKKLALAERMENLAALPDDQARFLAIREAQAQWKEIGPGIQDQEDAVWERFRKPIDAYFAERKLRMEPERLQREENAKLKEDLCLEAESLRDSTEWKSTIEKIKSLQARWKATGPAPRELDNQYWRRFRAACDAFFDRLKEYGASRDQDREANLRKKESLCFTVEILGGRSVSDEEAAARAAWAQARLADDPSFHFPESANDWQKDTDRVKAIQQEWRKIGPVAREKNEPLWERFLRASDAFFEERRRAMGLPADDPQANLESKLALIEEADGYAQNPGPHQEEALRALRAKWKRIGPVPRAQSDYVWERFNAACDIALGHEPAEANAEN